MNGFTAVPTQLTIVLHGIEDTERFANHLAKSLFLPMVITLSGEIGAGKTTLIRALLRALGVEGSIKSPTYSLLETYELPKLSAASQSPAQCHHFDLYRVVDESELEFIGFRDYFQSNAVCCIEWPERISLPPNLIDLNLFLSQSNHGRRLCIEVNAKTSPLMSQCLAGFNEEHSV